MALAFTVLVAQVIVPDPGVTDGCVVFWATDWEPLAGQPLLVLTTV